MTKNCFFAPRNFLAIALTVALTGCASFSDDGGLAKVQQLTGVHTGTTLTWIKSEADSAGVAKTVSDLLEKPLSVEDAVKVALLNNRGLQASYAELGIAESDLVQAGRMSNPAFTFSHLRNGDGVDIDRKLLLPVIGLLTMPMAKKIERHRFEEVQLSTAAEVLRVADETRRAYFGTLAAQQTVDYMTQVQMAAEASAELAKRMVVAGNWSKLRQAREQAFYADTVAQLSRAKQNQLAARERLIRLLGLGVNGNAINLPLPDHLPELPAVPREISDAENQALANRLDLLIEQKNLAALASSLGLSRTTRFVNVLDVSYLRNTGRDIPGHASGYEIEWQIPLFDWGDAKVVKAEAVYMQAVNRSAEIAVNARSIVRESYASYRSAYDLARHYRDEIVPLKKRISDEQMLRYNGMLISVFELLADAREQVVSVNASIEALRDFWIADSALKAAMTGADAGMSSTRKDLP